MKKTKQNNNKSSIILTIILTFIIIITIPNINAQLITENTPKTYITYLTEDLLGTYNYYNVYFDLYNITETNITYYDTITTDRIDALFPNTRKYETGIGFTENGSTTISVLTSTNPTNSYKIYDLNNQYVQSIYYNFKNEDTKKVFYQEQDRAYNIIINHNDYEKDSIFIYDNTQLNGENTNPIFNDTSGEFFKEMFGINHICLDGNNTLKNNSTFVGLNNDDETLYLFCYNTSENKLFELDKYFYSNKIFYESSKLNSITLENIKNYLEEKTIINSYNGVISTNNNVTYYKINSDNFYYEEVEYIDIYNGLICNEAKTECYNQSGVCFPREDKQYLCENVLLSENDYTYYFYCNTENLTYCGECINENLENEYGINYLSGTCSDDIDCTNECRIEGETYSDTATSYRTCGFYDDDICLEWSTPTSCLTGEVSENGMCVELNTSDRTYYSLNNFQIIPELVEARTYNLDAIPKTINLRSTSAFLVNGYDYQTTSSESRIKQVCDYSNEEILINEDLITIDKSNNTHTETFTNYNNGITQVNFDMVPNESVSITGINIADNALFNYTIVNNVTNQLCVYDDLEGELIGCREVTSDCEEVQFFVQSINEYGFYSTATKTNIVTSTSTKSIYSGFKNTNNDNTYNELQITTNQDLSPSDEINITKIRITNENNNDEAFKQNDWLMKPESVESAMERLIASPIYQDLREDLTITQINDYYRKKFNYYEDNKPSISFYPYGCYYNSEGEYTLRAYESTSSAKNGYWNFKEIQVNVEDLSGSNVGTEFEESFFNKLTQTQKLLLSFITLIIIIGGFMGMGLLVDNLKVFTYIGVAIAVGFVGYFAIIGFIPVWILILMFTISALIVSSMITNAMTNRG